LSPAALAQPRAIRRQLAADAMGMALDTFQRKAEDLLLADVANDMWMVFGRAVPTDVPEEACLDSFRLPQDNPEQSGGALRPRRF
jgi:hypothetical protein